MTYDELFDCIMNAKDIISLKKGMKEFIMAYLAMGNDEGFVAELSDKLEMKKDNPIHYFLYSYLNSPESYADLDFELIGFEFECNSWKKTNKKDSYQLSKEDFLEYFEIFEKRYQLKQAIESHYEFNIVEMGLEPKHVTSVCIIKGNIMNILLPKCKKEIEKESALSLVMSRMILEVINRKMSGYRVNKLFEIFIPQMKEYNSKIFGGMLKEVIVAAEGNKPTEYALNSEEDKLEIFQIISNELKIPDDEYVDVDW